MEHYYRSIKNGFTLAEVLITLGVIGVVAAMTLPSVIAKYQKQQTIAKLKKAYSTLGQLVLRSQENNGPAAFSTSDTVDAEVVKNFFNTYWFPYLNGPVISKEGVCPYGSDSVCAAYSLLSGSVYDTSIYTNYPIGRVFFTTNDGIAYYVDIMRWENKYDDDGNLVSHIAKYSTRQNVLIDVNGVNPPNTFGKDVFMFIINFDDSLVRPYGHDKTESEINDNCKLNGSGAYCAAKLINDGWQMKKDYPW